MQRKIDRLVAQEFVKSQKVTYFFACKKIRFQQVSMKYEADIFPPLNDVNLH